MARVSLWQDVRYGLRGMRSNPGFSALAMVTRALGIGAATTMFSAIENVLVAPFPYRGADRTVAFDIHNLDHAHPGGRQALKAAEYLKFRAQNHVFTRRIMNAGLSSRRD
jgi:putative ABC transport system permease protein